VAKLCTALHVEPNGNDCPFRRRGDRDIIRFRRCVARFYLVCFFRPIRVNLRFPSCLLCDSIGDLFSVVRESSVSSLFYFTSALPRRAYVRPMIYGTDLIRRVCGVTRLHVVAHANTINHCEYELETPHGGAIRNRPNVCSFLPPTSRLSLSLHLPSLIDDAAMTVAACC
jgi:hypothetical protein